MNAAMQPVPEPIPPADSGDLHERMQALKARLKAAAAESAATLPPLDDPQPTDPLPTGPTTRTAPTAWPPLDTGDDTGLDDLFAGLAPDQIDADDTEGTERDPATSWPAPDESARSPISRFVWQLALLTAALLVIAFFGWRLLSTSSSPSAARVATPTTAQAPADETPSALAATDRPAAPTQAPPPATVAPGYLAPPVEIARGGSPDETPPVTAEPGVSAADVIEAGYARLIDAGHPELSLRFDDGVLEVSGVVSVDDAAEGWFANVAAIEDLLGDVDGVDRIVSHLGLRGDEARLRKQLAAIASNGNLEFAIGSAQLTKGADAALENAAQVIRANPGLRVLVAGHTDASGSAAANADLATSRAGAVVSRLVELGVPVTRLQVVSYGELFPGANTSDAENRRVDFEVAP